MRAINLLIWARLCIKSAIIAIKKGSKRMRVAMRKVVIEVLGGIAYVRSAPKGIDVEIIDLDITREGEDK